MIKRLVIRNFQSHKDTSLEFVPGVNVIIGQSDSGKTAIIRALRWAVWNRPLGDSFKSHWGGDTSVLVEMDECRVERFKGKEDHYKLWVDDGLEPLEFKAFGVDPPDEIGRALGFSELNLQNQHDPAFLISNNPGEVARHFNKVANIDQIDSSLRAVESWIRSINQDIKTQESNISEYQEQVREYEYLDKLEAQVESLEHMSSLASQLSNKAHQLSGLLDSLEQVEEEIRSKSETLSALPIVKKALERIQDRSSLVQEYKQLKDLCVQIIECERQITRNQELVQDKNAVELVLELYNKKEGAEAQYKSLRSLIGSIEESDRKILDKSELLEDLETEWHKNMPEICPLCGN